MPLEEYRRKRDFASTPEPAGAGEAATSGALSFVIQEHHATARHFDFRLELDGVLVSWAVPKGPSYDPADKRLAMRVEDHPLTYASFEGVIPKDQYGGGTVIVWDRGTWSPAGDPRAGLEKGDLKFELSGEKLHGRWVLVRMKPRPGEHGEPWLLIKERDEFIRPRTDFDVTMDEPRSVLSGKTVAEMAQEPVATYGDPLPRDVGFELATLVKDAPPGQEWIAEVKYDGYRMLASVEDGRASIRSRNGVDWTSRLPRLAGALASLPVSSALIDGEAVVFDEHGVSRFQLLQNAFDGAPERAVFAAFDLLHLNGSDLRGLGLLQRKELLRAVLADEGATSGLHYVDHVEGDAPAVYSEACGRGLEGIIAKRIGSPYIARRTRDWLKVKCLRHDEFVIGGFTEPKGGREGFGALLVGCHDTATGDLHYRGRVGSGFSDVALRSLEARLRQAVRKTPPFVDPPHTGSADTVHWVTPSLIVQVSYAEVTAEGLLRQPVFLGVREDKSAHEVVCEAPEEAPATDGDPEAVGVRGSEIVLGVTISNTEKRLFPESVLSKAELAHYYERLAPLMVPEVGNRFLTLVRCPSGEGRDCFYQRHPDVTARGHVRHTPFRLSDNDPQEWLFVDDAPGLVELAQRGVSEIHMWGSRIDTPTRPDRLVFDLDPGPGLTWEALAHAAVLVRDELTALGFTPFVKVTGGKGLHVVTAIEPVWEFDRVKPLTKAFALRLAERHPDLFVAKMTKAVRGERVYVDYLRNAAGSSAVGPYSTRNRPGPSVAAPVSWDEIRSAHELPVFTPAEVIERLDRRPDPWHKLAGSASGPDALEAAESALTSR